ncbi:GAF domain-containing protein [Rhizobium sp. ARZ01]|uniref:sensor histidine kinase n=1 Tax=Rhizobium sp. ARZ01 TaxID=2769313 RepID=UPI0017820570|nr:HWE histidine kinase domain-containing protein [Rhizobium sp. ARZ01]MBD9373309.1 GAF domain-containing protein [Rhizobium sp. ARZ01]
MNSNRPSSLVAAALASPERLAAVEATLPAYAGPDAEFTGIADLAAGLFSAPIAVVSLIGGTTQWFLARKGTAEVSASAQDCFCARLLTETGAPLVIGDALQDERFSKLPSVTGGPHLRFYAGAPIMHIGQTIGSVCVLDVAPRDFVSDEVLLHLQQLAKLAGSLLLLKEEARRRAIANTAIAREEQRQASALDAANVGSWLWNIQTGAVVGNPPLVRMLDLKSGAALNARRIFSAIHVTDRKATIGKLREALKTGAEYDGIFRAGATGRWLLGRGRVHEWDSEGRPLMFLGITLDVTEGQIASERMRLLLRELNHRVKNTLAMLQSLARQTLRQTNDPAAFMEAFAGRLQAISEAHGLLSDHEWGGIRLTPLLRAQIRPYADDFEAQVEIHKDEVHLGPDQAIGLGLVLHELASNARKYGALSASGGKLVITARVVQEEGKPVLHMTWHEVGGPPVTPPKRHGFGVVLIERSLDKVLGSSVHLEFLQSGLTALVRLPLD